MPVQIHYDGATYTEINHDADDAVMRATAILNSPLGAGVFRVETVTGTVDLFISRSIPIAIEDKHPVRSKYETDDLTVV